MNLDTLRKRTDPSKWVVASNNGVTIVASNLDIGEVYNGSVAGYNAIFKAVLPKTGNIETDFDALGNAVGIVGVGASVGYLSTAPLFVATALEARGDSLTAGFSFTVGQLDPTKTYASLFNADYNPTKAFSNYGTSGSLAVFQYAQMTNASTTPNQTDGLMSVWLAGYNDMRIGVTETQLNCFYNSFAAGLLLTLGNWSGFRQYFNGGGGGTFYGAPAGSLVSGFTGGQIGSFGVNGSWRGLKSTTNNDTLTAKVNGDVVYVVYCKNTVNIGGTFAVSIDGVSVVASVVCDGTGSTTSGDNPALLRIPTTPGNHSVVITITSATGAANQVTIETIAGNSDLIRKTASVIGLCPRMNAAGYVASTAAYASQTIGDAAVSKYQAIQREVVAQFSADGFNVRAVDISATYDPTTAGNVQTDNIHMTTLGQAQIYKAFQRSWLNTQPVNVAYGSGVPVQTIAPPASGISFRNMQRYPVDVLFSGGTITAIGFSRDNITYITIASSTATPVLLRLNPLDYYQLTYSVAPTVNVIGR